MKILFLSDYDPRYIGIWYQLPFCYILALRYCIAPKNKFDETCYKIVTKAETGIKETKVIKTLITPFKNIKDVCKATIEYKRRHDAIILAIDE